MVNIISQVASFVLVIAICAFFVVLSVFSGLKNFGLNYSKAFDPDIKISHAKLKHFDLSTLPLNKLAALSEIKTFSKIIEEFDPMDLSKSLELKRILNSYPYFQSASAHYLKTLKLQKKDAYFELLPKSAILTFNRSILRDWLYSSDINEDQTDDSKEKYSFLDWFDI